jgi:hypothetical protein
VQRLDHNSHLTLYFQSLRSGKQRVLQKELQARLVVPDLDDAIAIIGRMRDVLVNAAGGRFSTPIRSRPQSRLP